MTKKLCPHTVQNYIKNMPKYAMATEAETNGTHYGNQNFFIPNFNENYRLKSKTNAVRPQGNRISPLMT